MRNLLFRIIIMGILLQISYTLLPPPFKDAKVQPKVRYSRFRPSNENIEDAIDFAKRYTKNLERFESTIQWPSHIEPGTPVHGLFISHAPDWKAIERGRQAYIATKAASQLAYTCLHEKGMSLETCSDTLINLNYFQSSLNESCSYIRKKCTVGEARNKYRSIDGTCNHITKASMGESFSAYGRLLDAKYMNLFEVPKRSVNKMPLPSARKISTGLVTGENDPHESLTVAFTVFGQFVEHDLSNFAASVMINQNDSFSCCDISGFNMAPRYQHPLCMPISVPTDDNFYAKKHVECISYARSFPAMRSDCAMGYLEQQNQATHYLDASQIYGSYLEKSMYLRLAENGKLSTSHYNFLLSSEEPQQKCQVESENDVCFVSGDTRVNLHPQLTAMYTLWTREHNRIAHELSKLNPHWDDERIFQETRRIVIAEIQHITYDEWLKNLLAPKYIDVIEKQSSFREDTDPSVSNEFATGAIRFLQSMFSGNISVINRNGAEIAVLKMPNHFNRPAIITKKGMFDAILRGLVNDSAQQVGVHYSKDFINNYLSDENYGYDVFSIDIQRGRDHGLPGYTSYRRRCGLSKAVVFNDFLDVMSNESVEAVSKVYVHVDDVDLLVGGLLEKPIKNSLLGQTFSCIIGDQFYRTRRGDRYFYNSDNQPTPFDQLQTDEIRKSTMARIICDNSFLNKVQRRVFEKVSASNPLTSCLCDRIPKLNLSPWKDATQKMS